MTTNGHKLSTNRCKATTKRNKLTEKGTKPTTTRCTRAVKRNKLIDV